MSNAVLVLDSTGQRQTWSDGPRHTLVPTRREPTKSAVAGMACQASGHPFSDDAFVAKVAALEQVSRCDREGSVAWDFNVVRDVPQADGEKGQNHAYPLPTEREYLENYSFKIALGGDETFLRELYKAFMLPAGLLWLGKKACQPSRPIWIPGGLVTTGETPRQVLERWPWNRPRGGRQPKRLRLVLDLGVGSCSGELRHDYPISLDPNNRRFVDRRVETVWIQTENLPLEQTIQETTGVKS